MATVQDGYLSKFHWFFKELMIVVLELREWLIESSFLRKKSIWKAKQERETYWEISSVCWFTPQMTALARTRSSQSQEPGKQVMSPMWAIWAQILGPSFAAFSGPLTRNWIGSGGAGTPAAWSANGMTAGTSRGSLVCCATYLSPGCSFFEVSITWCQNQTRRAHSHIQNPNSRCHFHLSQISTL